MSTCWRKSRSNIPDEINSAEETEKQEGQQKCNNPGFSVNKNLSRGVIECLRGILSCTCVAKKVGKTDCDKTKETKCTLNLSSENIECSVLGGDINTAVTDENTHYQSEVKNVEISNFQNDSAFHDFMESHFQLLEDEDNFSQEDLDKALILACQKGYDYLVQKLIECGATAACRDPDGNTPLMFCCSNGFVELARFLLTEKSDLNAANFAGDTALILCLQSPQATELTVLLLQQKGIDIQHKNEKGATALLKSIEVCDISTTYILLINYKMTSTKSSSWEKVYNSACNNYKSNITKDMFEKHGLGMVLQMLTEYIKCYKNVSGLKASILDLAVTACDVESLNTFLDCVDLDKQVQARMINKAYENFLEMFTSFSKCHILMIEQLLKLGAEMNHCPFVSPVLVATKAGSCPLVELLCQHGADLEKKHLSIVSVLLPVTAESELPPSTVTNDMWVLNGEKFIKISRYYSALDHALCFGDMSCAKVLLRHGAQINIESALLTALHYHSINYINFLFTNYNHETLTCISQNKKSLLMSAVRKTNVDVFSRIFEAAGNITENYFCIEELLIEARDEDIARFLIKKGADVNKIITTGENHGYPLMIICKSNVRDPQLNIVKILLENGASANIFDKGISLLMHIASDKYIPGLLEILLDFGADINLKDTQGYTALMYSASKGCLQNTTSLIKYAEKSKNILNTHNKNVVNAQNNEGLTALMFAVTHKHISITEELINHGSDLDITDNKGNTALFHAFWNVGINNEKSLVDIVTTLVKAGCDINCQNKDGCSPLMLATDGFVVDAISVLLEAGADVNAISKTDSTKTALSPLQKYSCDYNKLSVYLSHFFDQGSCSSDIMSMLFHIIALRGSIERISKLISNRAGPLSVRSDTIDHVLPAAVFEVSPLCTALLDGNMPLACYFMKIMFLTSSDMSSLMYNQTVREYLKTMNYTHCLGMLDEISSQPASLFRLAFVTVSSAVETTPGRAIRVNMLPLPQVLKDRLLFKSLPC